MLNVPPINLASKRHISFLDKFINWALSIGRVVVIVTEGVALAAFLYRFSLDGKLVDLHDQILQQERLISQYEREEHTFRNLQERLHSIAQLSSTSSTTIKTMQDMDALITPDIQVTNISYAQGTIQIQAQAQSVTSLSHFVSKLKAYPKVQTVTLNNILNKASVSSITFDVTAVLKKSQAL